MATTAKVERRAAKSAWLAWRAMGRRLERRGGVVAIEPGPGVGLAEFCRWRRGGTPTIAVRVKLAVTMGEQS